MHPHSPETPELLFESTLFSFEKQYKTQRDTLATLGYFVDKIVDLQRDPTLEYPRVILGIDGREYSFPHFADIRSALTKDKETKDYYAEQFRRGFTDLRITPFALSINTHLSILRQAILREYTKNGGHIYSAAEKMQQYTTVDQIRSLSDQEFPLNPDDPLYQWDQYTDADTNGDLVYFPTQFTSDSHGGQTKQQLLDAQRQNRSPFQGYLLSFTHTHTDIPRAGKSPSKHLFEAGQSSNEYLNTIQQAEGNKDHLHYNQRGQTIEEVLATMATTLATHHQLTDDYNKHGSFNYATGSYIQRSGYVPCVYADRGNRRVFAAGFGPRFRDSDGGSRSAVGI